MNETTTPDNDTERGRHERRLQTAKRLLAEADTDADILAHCRAVLETPGYDRCRAKASLDACSVLLALTEADVSTKRTREASQLLAAVAGGQR
ncbi:hypothetical protein [Haloarcula sp. H-GB5]